MEPGGPWATVCGVGEPNDPRNVEAIVTDDDPLAQGSPALDVALEPPA